LESIDIIRGIALFGVLMVNLVTEFRVSIFQQFLPPSGAGPWWDRYTEASLDPRNRGSAPFGPLLRG
jgi:uncharacterized protein